MVHGKRQTVSYPTEGVYSQGTQRLIQRPFGSIQIVGQWDGVNNDRFTSRLYHAASGDQCCLAHVFKV